MNQIPAAFSTVIQSETNDNLAAIDGSTQIASSASNSKAVESQAGNSTAIDGRINEPNSTLNFNLSSIYGDLSSIVNMFGKFEPFLRYKGVHIDAQMFSSLLERYLVTRYGSADGIIEHFYMFLSEELYSWYFDLAATEKAKWSDFQKSFVNKANDLEYELYELTALNKSDFLAKLKERNPSDSKLHSSISTSPITTYFSEKLRILSLVHPRMQLEEMVLSTFAHLGDKQLFMKLFKYRKDSDVLFFMTKKEDKLIANKN